MSESEVSKIIAKSNREIEKDFASLQKAQLKLQSMGQKEDVSSEQAANVTAILVDSIRHYTEHCKFLAPGMEVLEGNTAFKAVLLDYTHPESRGHDTMKIEIQQAGPFGSDGDLFYERGTTVFEGPNYYQKNNHMTIRKKVIDDGQVTYPIDTLIFNEIKNEKKN